jgi:hypothetical protein
VRWSHERFVEGIQADTTEHFVLLENQELWLPM